MQARDCSLLALLCCLGGWAGSVRCCEAQWADEGAKAVTQLALRDHGVSLRLSDVEAVQPLGAAELHDDAWSQQEQHEYPAGVSRDPGWPRKPRWSPPGDVNVSQCPPPRYLHSEGFRSGWAQSVRRWSGSSINPHYYAWYVGGGSARLFPHGRAARKDEGTWGLDYSLWKSPRTVFMAWTTGREQGGEGAYETERP